MSALEKELLKMHELQKNYNDLLVELKKSKIIQKT